MNILLYKEATKSQQERLEATYDSVLALLRNYRAYDSKIKKDHVIRSIGLWIFEFKDIKALATNAWSIALIEDYNDLIGNKGYGWSKIPKASVRRLEHFYGRNAAARTFLEEYFGVEPNFDDFCRFIEEYGKYHYTTADENQEVKKAFNNGAKDWVEAYQMAGIKLYRVRIRKEGRSNKEVIAEQHLDAELLRKLFRY